MIGTVSPPRPRLSKSRWVRTLKKTAKRVIPFGLAAWFIPIPLAVAVAVGLVDFSRNSARKLSSLDRYFAGNGIFTWLLSPFNLVMDILCLPYRNRGVYKLEELPPGHQAEIKGMIETAHASNLMERLAEKMGDQKRGMIFWKWYGKNMPASIDIPEYHKQYKYIRTIGCSVFNKKASTGKHYGPLRITLRVLYNINRIDSDKVFVKVGTHTNYWRDNQLFIFDDTLQHQSCNQSDEVRYCMFVDILRPSYVNGLLGAILAVVRVITARFNAMFYKHWKFIK